MKVTNFDIYVSKRNGNKLAMLKFNVFHG